MFGEILLNLVSIARDQLQKVAAKGRKLNLADAKQKLEDVQI